MITSPTWPLCCHTSPGPLLFLNNFLGVLVSSHPCPRGPNPCPHFLGLPFLTGLPFLVSLLVLPLGIRVPQGSVLASSPSLSPFALTPLVVSSSPSYMPMTHSHVYLSSSHFFSTLSKSPNSISNYSVTSPLHIPKSLYRPA